jgi:hypothetical protein
MSERELLICGKHGETPATFQCRHLATGVACGYHASAENPADRWPDAWCDACQEAFQAAGGEWTDEAQAHADIQVRCTRCYEEARDRNRAVPLPARGAHARLDDRERATLLRHAVRVTQAAQERSQARWGWGDHARWDYAADAATLTFTDPERPTAIADVQLVGSYSTRSGTFQWAWQTFDAGEPQAEPSARVRVFGEVRGIPQLTTANRACAVEEAWEMASIASYLLGSEGVYRAPMDHLYWFMLLSGWRTPS